ncbi:MAG: aminoacyl-histidine dipeptidase, partial [Marinilabiliales bacterium]|nr:aminoacyl-histidine dipeptidase [Marinilabiliales bacterium]
MSNIGQLYPSRMWQIFEDICQVPRPSKHEEKIIQYLIEFAESNALPFKKDHAGNILIQKAGTPGYEDCLPVVLQAHMDMVCEKNEGVRHDFLKDPIHPYEKDGWVTAGKTTLGADCGMGMASMLAILESHDIEHPPIEALFTVDEETGLTGAKALQSGFISGKILINLDSEDEGEIFIGCAGGVDSVGKLHYTKTTVPDGMFACKISVSGLSGGHSGDDIGKGRGNSIKILNRFLYEYGNQNKLHLASFQGGNLRNAIPREAQAILVIPYSDKEKLTIALNHYRAMMENELLLREPGFKVRLESQDLPEAIMGESSQSDLLRLIYSIPHGVVGMSFRMPGMVETSTNLASIRFCESDIVEIVTSQRSDLESGKEDVAQMVESCFLQAGAKVVRGEGYCGWAPNPDSDLLKKAVVCYETLFGLKPVVRSIHAGLECGLFSEKFPEL